MIINIYAKYYSYDDIEYELLVKLITIQRRYVLADHGLTKPNQPYMITYTNITNAYDTFASL